MAEPPDEPTTGPAPGEEAAAPDPGRLRRLASAALEPEGWGGNAGGRRRRPSPRVVRRRVQVLVGAVLVALLAAGVADNVAGRVRLGHEAAAERAAQADLGVARHHLEVTTTA